MSQLACNALRAERARRRCTSSALARIAQPLSRRHAVQMKPSIGCELLVIVKRERDACGGKLECPAAIRQCQCRASSTGLARVGSCAQAATTCSLFVGLFRRGDVGNLPLRAKPRWVTAETKSGGRSACPVTTSGLRSPPARRSRANGKWKQWYDVREGTAQTQACVGGTAAVWCGVRG